MDDESQTFVNTHPVRQFPSPGRLERHLPSEFEREKSWIENFACCFHIYTRILFFSGGILFFIFWICRTFK